MAEVDDLYGDDVDSPVLVANKEDQTMHDTEQFGSDDTGSESDSEVEFVISTKPGQRAEPPVNRPYAAIKIQKPSGSIETSAKPEKKAPIAKIADVDVDAIAEMDGKSILAVDLETLENKPWRQPGADITEYFNYGFDEFTWTAYCQKQAALRKDFAPGKVMQSMMSGMDPAMMGALAGPGMMMPPMDPSMMYNTMPMNFMAPTNAGFDSQMHRPPPPGMNPQRDIVNASQIPSDRRDRDHSATPAANIPKGPANPRNNYRSRSSQSRR